MTATLPTSKDPAPGTIPAMIAPRVCHLGKYYPPAPGGMESHVQTLARAQAALGLGVRAFCVNHLPGPTTAGRDGEVEVTRFARGASAAKLDLCPDLVGALARVEADILHLHVPNPTMIVALLRARPAIPLVVTYHSDIIRQRLLGALFRPLERLAYRRVPRDPDDQPRLPGRFELPEALRRPPGSPAARHRPGPLPGAGRVRPRGGRPSPRRYPGPLWVGCGRLVYYKGFLNAIRALPHVPGTLLIVGKGPDRPELEAEARGLGVADRVILTGSVPVLTPYYLAADAFWFPSNARSEAFGLVQVEAMASGCPVLNTHVPHSGVDWVSLHEETGLTVPVNDPTALAAAANRLLAEPGLRDRLSVAARERAVRMFDHRAMADRSLAIYRRILAEEPSPRPAGLPALAGGL